MLEKEQLKSLETDLGKIKEGWEMKNFIRTLDFLEVPENEDVYKAAKEKLARIESRVQEITSPVETSPSEISEIHDYGGSPEVMKYREFSVDEKIRNEDRKIQDVLLEAQRQMDEVEKKISTEDILTPSELENFKNYMERIDNPAELKDFIKKAQAAGYEGLVSLAEKRLAGMQ
jgi:hypothetical protein